MEICRNKKTGQTFIQLEGPEADQSLMITPQGAVKNLECKLFTESVDIDDERAVTQGKVNRVQYDVYTQFFR